VSGEAGFDDRFDELYRVAYRAAFGVFGERAEAEDCAQDALARLLIAWPRVEDYAAAWVARVSSNAAIDRWRRREREHRLPAGDAAIDPVESYRHDVVSALRRLPRRQREAVALRYLCDLSEAETAAAMGCSTGAVKSATSRGLDRMRRLLGSAFGLEGC
jgi:RNA polymerase sigma-70 factor (sigma-E family)